MDPHRLAAEPSPEVESEPVVGTVLGDRYEILRVLGSGGMGKVYEAKHVRLPRRFAIKLIHEDRVGDPATLERFRREAEITSSLGCVHIVDVVDFHTLPGGAPYLVMELLVGEDLLARMTREAPLSWDAIHTILRQVVAGLSAAHARGVLHRDIKPENIFLAQTPDHGELVKLLDFGLSKILNPKRPPTQMLLGTPYFMSPEQAKGGNVDLRTDVYALGVVAYQLLSGHLPHEGETTYEVLAHLATKDPVPPSQWRPELAGPVEDAIMAALVRDPEQRLSSVEALWARLGPALQTTAKPTPSAAPVPAARPTEWESGPPSDSLGTSLVAPTIDHRPLLGVGAVALLALAVVAWNWGRHPDLTPAAPPSPVLSPAGESPLPSASPPTTAAAAVVEPVPPVAPTVTPPKPSAASPTRRSGPKGHVRPTASGAPSPDPADVILNEP